MIKIYLCDNDKFWLKKIEQAIINYQVSSDWELLIAYRALSPLELLSYLNDHTPVNGIYFLDIDYDSSINGIDLGLEIRKLDSNPFLIYVTIHEEMVMETFRVKLMALDYIIKDKHDIKNEIHACLSHIENLYITHSNKNSNFLIIQIGSSRRVLLKQEIYYIESQKGCHKLLIHTRAGILSLNCSLNKLEKELGEKFILCNRGCLVNILHIIAIERNKRELILDNGEICTCSIRSWHKISDIIFQLP